jgi:hypothetical protein
VDHTTWCDTREHQARIDAEQTAHPDTPEWTGCVSAPYSLAVGGLTFICSLVQVDPGQVSATIEVSRDGRIVPASICVDAADAARVLAWAGGVLGQVAATAG